MAWGANSSLGAGIVSTAVASANGPDIATAAVLQSDGKLVVVGSCNSGNQRDFCVVRYKTDGTLDSDFNGSGKAFAPHGAGSHFALAVALQADGKIVVAGSCTNGALLDFCAVRYSPFGILDSSFNGTGKITTRIGNGEDRVAGAAIQRDGKILLSGYCINSGVSRFCAARYNGNDGSLDNSFNGSGTVSTGIGSGDDRATALAVQPDGGILLAGYCANGGNLDFCALRYTPEGLLDSSFNDAGSVITPIGSDADQANAMALQPDGKILVAGQCTAGSVDGFCGLRYTTSGALDSSFNGNGKVFVVVPGAKNRANAVTVQPDGKIVLGGTCASASLGSFCLTRLLSVGQVDKSFGVNGTVVTSVTNGEAIGNALALQPDGKILLVGTCNAGAAAAGIDFCAARYIGGPTNSPGTLDVAWGSSGRLIATLFGGRSAIAHAVAQVSGEKVVVAGECDDAGSINFCAIRLDSSGNADASFGIAGRVWTAVGTGDSVAQAVLTQPDGKIVLAGGCAGSNPFVFCLVRYDPSGALDTSFNGNGKVMAPTFVADFSFASAALQGDGKIVVTGTCNTGAIRQFCAARYMRDGALDYSFNGTGFVFTTVGSVYSLAVAGVVRSDGKIVVGGSCLDTNARRSNFCLARYHPDGTLDLSLNASGKAVVPPDSSTFLDRQAQATALQADGKVVIAGSCRTDVANQFCATRVNDDGSLDNNFNGTGWTATSFDDAGAGDSLPVAVTLQGDGKIIVTGQCRTGGGDVDFCALRYDNDGHLDKTFNQSGKLLTGIGLAADLASAATIQSDGKLLIVGRCDDNNNVGTSRFCVARYQGGPFGAQNCKLDLDGDGNVSSAVDLLIATRIAVGMTGSAVLASVSFQANAKRTTWPAIREYLVSQCGLSVPL